MSCPSFEDLLKYVVQNEVANALAQKQAKSPNLAKSAHIPGHAPSDKSPGLPFSKSFPDGSLPGYNPSSKASRQLSGARTPFELTAANGVFPSNSRLLAVPEDRQGSSEPFRLSPLEASINEAEGKPKQEPLSRSPSVEIIYARRIVVTTAPGSKYGTHPNKNSTAIETPAARSSIAAANRAGFSTRKSGETTETSQNGPASAPASSVFDNISRTPIRGPIHKRPVATDWFTPTPTLESAEPAHNKPAEYTRQDVGDLIEEEKAKALHETCRLAEEETTSPEHDHTAHSSTAPDNDGPTDYLARIEGYLNSMKSIKTKQDSYLQSRGISKRTLAIHPRRSDRMQRSHTDCQGTPAVPPSPTTLCPAKDQSDVSSSTVPGTEATTPPEVTSTPTTPQEIQPFQPATMANAVEDGEVLATNRRRGLKRHQSRVLGRLGWADRWGPNTVETRGDTVTIQDQ
ncbi:MAG: hypothetical protein Q9207_007213 [Kuettlingeria erythrocarpa]